jgi:hypothetical protein
MSAAQKMVDSWTAQSLRDYDGISTMPYQSRPLTAPIGISSPALVTFRAPGDAAVLQNPRGLR